MGENNTPSLTPADQQLFRQLSAPPPHIELPAMYTFSVLMSLALLLMLPVVYVGLVTGLGWIVFELLVTSGRLALAGQVVLPALLSFAGLIALLVLVALIKPLVRWCIEWLRAKDTHIAVSREEEPLLYAVVDQLSETLQTPKAMEIHVTTDVNASAGPRSIIGGLFQENTVLTIGLTLAAGLNVRQFLGIVAHELGHFSQSGGGTELTILVRLLNSWLANLALSRDAVDEFLDNAANHGIAPLRVALWLPMFCVGIARRLMTLLLITGHAASCYEARHKEFDADQFEAYLAGSEDFHCSTMRMRVLVAAYSKTMDDLQESWQQRRISDDLPTLVVMNAETIPAERQRQIQRLALTEQSSWHETHPSDAERIAAVRRLGLPGIVQDERPAGVLFRDLPALNRRATLVQLQESLEDEFDPSQLVPVNRVIRELREKEDSLTSLRRYFQGEFAPSRPIWPGSHAGTPPNNPQQVLNDLQSARNSMLAESQTVHVPLKDYDEIDTKLLSARQAQVFSRTGYWIDPVAFGLDILDGSPESVDNAVTTISRQRREMDDQLKSYDAAALQRLTCALRLLNSPGIQQRLPAESRARDVQAARTLVVICSQLREVHPLLYELRMQMCGLAPLMMLDRRGLNPQMKKWVDDHHRVVQGWISNVKNSLSAIAYPFEHSQGKISAGDYVVPTPSIASKKKAKHVDPLVETLELGGAVMERYMMMLIRVLGRLTLVAERVETAVGLQPLDDPAENNPLDSVEVFVQSAERESALHPSLASQVQGATRWAMQLGATVGLATLLIVGFTGIVLIARAKDRAMSQVTADETVDETEAVPSMSPVVPPQVPPPPETPSPDSSVPSKPAPDRTVAPDAIPAALGAIKKPIVALALSADGGHAAYSDMSGDVAYFQPGDQVPRAVFRMDKGWANAIAVSREGQRLACISPFERMVKLYSPRTGQTVKLHIPDQSAYALTFSNSGRHFAIGFVDKVNVFDVRRGEESHSFAIDARAVRLTFSPDDRWLLCADRNGQVSIWDHLNDDILAQVSTGSSIDQLRLSPDGQNLLTVSSEDVVTIWNIQSGNAIAKHSERDTRYAGFTPDGAGVILVTGRELQIRSIDLQRVDWNTKVERLHHRSAFVSTSEQVHMLGSAGRPRTVADLGVTTFSWSDLGK